MYSLYPLPRKQLYSFSKELKYLCSPRRSPAFPCTLNQVPATKGLLLGYSPGTTTLRAYADAPRLSNHWRPKRERRSSGLSCMKGQASRGVWQPIRAPIAPPPTRREGSRPGGRSAGNGVVDGVGSARNTNSRGGGCSVGGVGGGCDTRGRRGEHKFMLAADHVTAAAAAGDGLSDSESEDDEDDTPMPTPADARTAFDDTTGIIRGEAWGPAAASGSSGTPTTLVRDDGDSGTSVVRADEGGGGQGKGFARDRAMEALEEKRRNKRIDDAERLADRMFAIGAEVRKCVSSGTPRW